MTLRTDDFAGTGALSGNWTQQFNSLSRSNGAAKGDTASANNLAFWSADTWATDQESTVLIHSLSVGHFVGPSVRAKDTGAGVDAYFLEVSADVWNIAKFVDGTYTLIQDTGLIAANYDLLCLRIVGSTLKVYRNNVLVTDATDAALTTGSPGIFAFHTGARIEEWRGNDVLINQRRITSLTIAYT